METTQMTPIVIETDEKLRLIITEYLNQCEHEFSSSSKCYLQPTKVLILDKKVLGRYCVYHVVEHFDQEMAKLST